MTERECDHGAPASEDSALVADALRELVRREIADVEGILAGLPRDSHLETLCGLAIERLRICAEIMGLRDR